MGSEVATDEGQGTLEGRQRLAVCCTKWSGGTGSVTADQLYGPYGAGRYQSGAMPTDYGFTGQHRDSTTGLDYYVARYFDPAIGAFTSADTVLPGNGYDPWGLSRYAYVEGNPLIRTDPTGHWGPFDAIASAVSTVVQAVAPVVQATVSVVEPSPLRHP